MPLGSHASAPAGLQFRNRSLQVRIPLDYTSVAPGSFGMLPLSFWSIPEAACSFQRDRVGIISAERDGRDGSGDPVVRRPRGQKGFPETDKGSSLYDLLPSIRFGHIPKNSAHQLTLLFFL
jgi:hypothetical protein